MYFCYSSDMNSWMILVFGILTIYHTSLMYVRSKFTPCQNRVNWAIFRILNSILLEIPTGIQSCRKCFPSLCYLVWLLAKSQMCRKIRCSCELPHFAVQVFTMYRVQGVNCLYNLYEYFVRVFTYNCGKIERNKQTQKNGTLSTILLWMYCDKMEMSDHPWMPTTMKCQAFMDTVIMAESLKKYVVICGKCTTNCDSLMIAGAWNVENKQILMQIISHFLQFFCTLKA